MKQKTVYALLAFALLLTAGCADRDTVLPDGLIVRSGEYLPDMKDRFVYPVGMSGLDFSRPDEEEVKTLSSYALIRSVMDKPGLSVLLGVSSSSAPIAQASRVFFGHNSVPAFEKRDDRVKALTSYFAAFDAGRYTSLDAGGQMDFLARLQVLEVWFLRDAILYSMDAEQKKEAVSLVLKKHRQMQWYSDTSGAAMMGMMYAGGYPPVVAYFKEKGISSIASFEISGIRTADLVVPFAESYTR
ncbi:MAG: hypothetical protein LBP25_06835 [Tannerellaceae bacterium]|jgi:hypothetical protein|nr:hypothetical protein [Tannerellaceae bacterium]